MVEGNYNFRACQFATVFPDTLVCLRSLHVCCSFHICKNKKCDQQSIVALCRSKKLSMAMFLRLKRYSKLEHYFSHCLSLHVFECAFKPHTAWPQGGITSLVTKNLFVSSVSVPKLNTSLQGL